MRRHSIIRLAALAGTVGPIVLGGTLHARSVLEYDFMVGIGWHPVADLSAPADLTRVSTGNVVGVKVHTE